MNDELLLTISQDSPSAFASMCAQHTGEDSGVISTIVETAAQWHRRAPEACQVGLLARAGRDDVHRTQREEWKARHRCEAYVVDHAPRALGLIGWLQIALWIWRYRKLIREIIRLFRVFLSDRPAALKAVMRGPVRGA